MLKKKFKRIFNWPVRYKAPLTVISKWGVVDHQLVQSLVSLDMSLQTLYALKENTTNEEELELVEKCIEFMEPSLVMFSEGYKGYLKLRDVYKV